MQRTKKSHLLFITALALLSFANFSFAKTDISLSQTDISFSQDTIVEGNSVKIYARVYNNGDTDVLGQVIFLNNGKEMPSPQPVSLKPGTYDDVFINWKPTTGEYTIEAKVTGISPTDEDLGNNSVKKQVFIDSDTDKDGIGNKKDPDIDGDTFNNNADAFPLDKAKWEGETNIFETNNNEANLTDTQAVAGASDKKDTDSIYHKLTRGSGEKIKIDPNKFPLSMLTSAALFLGIDKNYIYFTAAVLLFMAILFLLNLRRRKKN